MPSFLTMGYTRTEEPLHIGIAIDNEDNMLWVIAVYRPDPNEWGSGFTRRIKDEMSDVQRLYEKWQNHIPI